MKSLKSIANFLFEAGHLSKTPRSFHGLLGSGSQSVAEHINRVCYIGYALAILDGNVDVGKVLRMCLLHDFAESRVSDLNYVHQKYIKSDEDKAFEDLFETLPFGDDFKKIKDEYEERESKESILVKDADNLEFILSLKEQIDIGNTRAKEWMAPALKRLKTDIAKQLAEEIVKTDSDEWWFSDKEDEWWVNRGHDS